MGNGCDGGMSCHVLSLVSFPDLDSHGAFVGGFSMEAHVYVSSIG